MTTTRAPAGYGVSGLRAAFALRAVVTAVLAIVVTFTPSPDPHSPAHTPQGGLLAVGLYEPVLAVVLLVGMRVAQRGRRARVALVVRAGLLAVIGLLALVLPITVRGAASSAVLLVALEVAAFAVGGALELIGGLAPGEPAVQRRDAVTMGGLQLVAAAMLAVVNPDATFAVGVLGMWAAITAVYLGIAAASVGRPGAR